MVWVDWCILVTIAVSAVFGAFRGFVKEALSLAAWIVGFWVALAHWDLLADRLGGWIDSRATAATLAFAILLVGTLLIGTVIIHFVHKGLEKAGLQGFDRALGALFGLVRGVAIVAVALLFVSQYHADRADSWRRSKLVPYFGPVVKWMDSHRDHDPDFGRVIG